MSTAPLSRLLSPRTNNCSKRRPAALVAIDPLERRQLLSATPEVTLVTADDRGYVTVRFNAAMDVASFTNKTVYLYKPGKNGKISSNPADDVRVPTPFSYSSTAEALKIKGNVTADTPYLIVLTTHVKGENGQSLHNSIAHPGSTTAYAVECTPVASGTDPTAIMTTNFGTITVVLYETKVAVTVNNFVRYADSALYDGTIVHRLLSTSTVSTNGIAVVQGGGFESTPDTSGLPTPIPVFPPIRLQAGISNTQGTIAMARTSTDNSATSQFFFNTVDNSGSLNAEPGSDGYAVFGALANASSAAVVSAIDAIPVQNLTSGQQSNFNDVPIDNGNYVIFSRIAIEDVTTPV